MEGSGGYKILRTQSRRASKRPAVAPRSALDRIRGFPGPRQQVIEAVDRISVDQAREDVAQIGVGLDVVKLAGLNHRT